MADKSGISWTHATWNPIAGCSIVSPGCANCYAMREAHRLGSNPKLGGKYAGLTKVVHDNVVWNDTVRFWPGSLMQPVKWTRPRLIFANSMSDIFHLGIVNADDGKWTSVDLIFAVCYLAQAHGHVIQMLTKRAGRMREYLNHRNTPERVKRAAEALSQKHGLSKLRLPPFEWPLKNVWMGISAERQQELNERWPDLQSAQAAVRWVSAEPLLSMLDPEHIYRMSVDAGPEPDNHWTYVDNAMTGFKATKAGGWDAAKIDWIVAGGESSKPREFARPTKVQWLRNLRDVCAKHGTPFFFKQWGEWLYDERVGRKEMRGDNQPHAIDETASVVCVGKAAAGDLLDGVRHHNWPAGFSGVGPAVHAI